MRGREEDTERERGRGRQRGRDEEYSTERGGGVSAGVEVQTGPQHCTVSGGEASELPGTRLGLVVIQQHNEIFTSVEGGLFNSLWSLIIKITKCLNWVDFCK